MKGGRAALVRKRNRGRIIDALRRRGRASRSELARMTGLSRTTVGSLVADLQALGLVVEYEEGQRRGKEGRGRPPVYLRLDLSAARSDASWPTSATL